LTITKKKRTKKKPKGNAKTKSGARSTKEKTGRIENPERGSANLSKVWVTWREASAWRGTKRDVGEDKGASVGGTTQTKCKLKKRGQPKKRGGTTS